MSQPRTDEPVGNARAPANQIVTPLMSLASRCDYIVGLIDERLTVPASCSNTTDARIERPCREWPRTEPGVEAGADDVAS